MKLIKKLNRNYIAYSFLCLIIAGIVIYYSISIVVSIQLEEKLKNSTLQIETMLKQGEEINYLPSLVEVSKISAANLPPLYSDTVIYNNYEDEYEEYRQLSKTVHANGQHYLITVRESKIESEDLAITLVVVIFLTLILFTGSLVFLSRKVMVKIWAPFYQNLKTIKQFSVKDHFPVQLKQTNIQEFDELNEVLSLLTTKISDDYRSLKQFTEDASHEIQTPLAIITAKLEALIDDSELSTQQTETIRSVFNSVRRLSRLNQGLVLLTKIENNQFVDSKILSVNLLIEEKLQDFHELLELKEIQAETLVKAELMLETNPVLADIVINNLFSNSVNHNSPKGKIQINILKEQLEICNSGEAPIRNSERLFARFYKENSSSKSVGLGLAIVNKICEVQGWQVDYRFEAGMHCFRIQFSPQK
ncbi:sensor histidine kinase [Mangrovibacterium lignilyticum]|uniref:sensor histidine kinase n=1 Tax=Mangrovibacterium lignilyticum TaxID=2668052 RepID=UPI0013D2E480|nr:HAMP domain-containing sensor histidine kinase [Mangrovibacterium lignilyticum]